MMELTESSSQSVIDYLVKCKLLSENEGPASYTKAGEGNMNLVMRLQTSESALIIKQSRTYVNKYPQIAAPIDRIGVEHLFFKEISKDPFFRKFSPEVLHFNEKEHLLVMEDLGRGSDYLSLYDDVSIISESEIASLIGYLVKLHQKAPKSFPSNIDMRRLNHEHIFDFPFNEANGFNLDEIQEGLAEVALPYQRNSELKKRIKEIGTRYLQKGKALLHGDFYPGSWLSVETGLKVIDPEFGYVGDPEFDLGVMLAHFRMAGMPVTQINKCIELYTLSSGLDISLLNSYQGIEIMRRLIGIAQLPLSKTIDEKAKLLEQAQGLIIPS